MNESSRNLEVSMREVWEVAYNHVQRCGAGDCGVCDLFERLSTDPRRPEWEREIRAAAEEAEFKRQEEVNRRKEFQDD